MHNDVEITVQPIQRTLEQDVFSDAAEEVHRGLQQRDSLYEVTVVRIHDAFLRSIRGPSSRVKACRP